MGATKLNELTILEALEGLRNGNFTVTDIVTSCLSQIEKYDSKIQAFITVTKDYALARAKELDGELKEKGELVFKKNLYLVFRTHLRITIQQKMC